MATLQAPLTEAYHGAEEGRRAAEAIAAIALGVLALRLADKLYDIAEDALEKEYEIRDRIFEIQSKYVNHWKDIEFPQRQMVSDTIYGLSAPGADYSGILSNVSLQGYNTGRAANVGIDTLNFKNRVSCDQRNCGSEVEMMQAVAIAQSTNYLYRHQERQRYDIDEDYRKFAALTHRGMEVKPDQVFGLMGNAASLYGAISGAAMQMTSGAASLASVSFGYAGAAVGGGS